MNNYHLYCDEKGVLQRHFTWKYETASTESLPLTPDEVEEWSLSCAVHMVKNYPTTSAVIWPATEFLKGKMSPQLMTTMWGMFTVFDAEALTAPWLAECSWQVEKMHKIMEKKK